MKSQEKYTVKTIESEKVTVRITGANYSNEEEEPKEEVEEEKKDAEKEISAEEFKPTSDEPEKASSDRVTSTVTGFSSHQPKAEDDKEIEHTELKEEQVMDNKEEQDVNVNVYPPKEVNNTDNSKVSIEANTEPKEFDVETEELNAKPEDSKEMEESNMNPIVKQAEESRDEEVREEESKETEVKDEPKDIEVEDIGVDATAKVYNEAEKEEEINKNENINEMETGQNEATNIKAGGEPIETEEKNVEEGRKDAETENKIVEPENKEVEVIDDDNIKSSENKIDIEDSKDISKQEENVVPEVDQKHLQSQEEGEGVNEQDNKNKEQLNAKDEESRKEIISEEASKVDGDNKESEKEEEVSEFSNRGANKPVKEVNVEDGLMHERKQKQLKEEGRPDTEVDGGSLGDNTGVNTQPPIDSSSDGSKSNPKRPHSKRKKKAKDVDKKGSEGDRNCCTTI